MKCRFLSVLTLTLLLTMALTFVTVPEEASATGTITCEISSPVGQVEVFPGATGSISYAGKVSGEFLGTTGTSANPVTVTLSASCSDGGSAVVSPSSVLLTQQDNEKTFNVYVRIPPGTTYTVTPIVRISGTAQATGFTQAVPEATQAVEIIQYSWTNIETPAPYLEVSPGDQAVFSLKINNLGNGQETYIVDITNADELPGWILPPRQRLTVEEKSPKTYTLSLSTPQKFTFWKNDVFRVSLKITSDALGKAETYDVYVRVKGMYIPGFEPTFAIIALAGIAAMLRHRYNAGKDEETE